MRKNLKVFRVYKDMTQTEIAEKIGCTRATYSSIESGAREGRKEFWKKLQRAFNIIDEDMWALMQNEE